MIQYCRKNYNGYDLLIIEVLFINRKQNKTIIETVDLKMYTIILSAML